LVLNIQALELLSHLYLYLYGKAVAVAATNACSGHPIYRGSDYVPQRHA
jgi:hypothetical protein